MVTVFLNTTRAAVGTVKPPLNFSFQFQMQRLFQCPASKPESVWRWHLFLLLSRETEDHRAKPSKIFSLYFYGDFKSTKKRQITRNVGVRKGTRSFFDFFVSKSYPPHAKAFASPVAMSEGSLHGTTS